MLTHEKYHDIKLTICSTLLTFNDHDISYTLKVTWQNLTPINFQGSAQKPLKKLIFTH